MDRRWVSPACHAPVAVLRLVWRVLLSDRAGAVVGGPACGVAEHGVCGKDVLQDSVGGGGLRGGREVAGVGVMLAQQVAVGVGDLVLGGLRRESQDRVEVGEDCCVMRPAGRVRRTGAGAAQSASDGQW